jgi:hypothetical protein
MIDFLYKSEIYTVDKNGCIDRYGKIDGYISVFSYDLVWK